MYKRDLEDFILSLYDVGCVKFGEFVLSSGLKTPVYFDLRILVSFPNLMHQASQLIAKYIAENQIEYDVICGVPYGAFAIATSLSLMTNKPMIFSRKEVKDYGTKKMVEGVYKPEDKCLLIEDVVVYGTSIIETTECLKEYKLNVKDTITLLDREQGGPDNISDFGVRFHSIMKASDLLQVLYSHNKITKGTMEETIEFLHKHTYQAATAPTSQGVPAN